MTNNKYDIIVIGSGPGGYIAAVRAAQSGLKVACVEKSSRLGGVCLNVGCIPSKALLDSSEYYHLAEDHFAGHGIQTGKVKLDLSTMMERKNGVVKDLTDSVDALLKSNHITVIHGTAILAGEKEVEVNQDDNGSTLKLTGENILLATGSEPLTVPGLPYDGERIVTSTEALAFPTVPKHLVIVGGGYIGLELGSVWARLGSKVTVIEMMPQIAGSLDGQVSRTLLRLLKKQGINFKLQTKVEKAQISGKSVNVKISGKGSEETIECDRLLVAVGRKPLTGALNLDANGVKTDAKTGHVIVNEYYQTSVPSIYAIGDLIYGPMLAHKASAEGRAAIEHIAGIPGEVNYDTIPGIVYTWPEVASVGITEEYAKKKNISYCVGTYPFSGAGRARCMGEKDGFVKIISQAKTDRILGVHIIGPRASDMIAEAVLAMEFGASAEDIARTIHGHPTFAEALQEAALTSKKCSVYTG